MEYHKFHGISTTLVFRPRARQNFICKKSAQILSHFESLNRHGEGCVAERCHEIKVRLPCRSCLLSHLGPSVPIEHIWLLTLSVLYVSSQMMQAPKVSKLIVNNTFTNCQSLYLAALSQTPHQSLAYDESNECFSYSRTCTLLIFGLWRYLL